MRVGEERIVSDPSLGAEHALQQALVRIKERQREGPAVTDERRQGVALLHRHEEHGRAGPALLHTLDDAAVADIAEGRGEKE